MIVTSYDLSSLCEVHSMTDHVEILWKRAIKLLENSCYNQPSMMGSLFKRMDNKPISIEIMCGYSLISLFRDLLLRSHTRSVPDSCSLIPDLEGNSNVPSQYFAYLLSLHYTKMNRTWLANKKVICYLLFFSNGISLFFRFKYCFCNFRRLYHL